MKNLFTISSVDFYDKDFQDNLSEFEDLIPIIQEVQDKLTLEKIQCVDLNDCCKGTKMNLFAEIQGAVDEEGIFYFKGEIDQVGKIFDLFVIRIYKCCDCGKWIIDILE